MKRRFLVLAAISLGLLTSCGSSATGQMKKFSGISTDTDPEKIIVQTLLKDAAENYDEGECQAEGHIILGLDDKKSTINVTALTSCGNYQFQNSNFVHNSGCGAIPTLFVMKRNDSGALVLDHVEYPAEGSDYQKSVKKMFSDYLDRCSEISEADKSSLKEQELKYASEHLKKIGRTAKIGDTSDFSYMTLTEAGASAKVVSRASEYGDFPTWVGVIERIDRDVRFSFETSYDREKDEVHFVKKNMVTNEVLVDRIISINSK